MATDWSPLLLVVLLAVVVGATATGTVSAASTPAETDAATAIDGGEYSPASVQDSLTFAVQSSGNESDSETGNETETDPGSGDESDNSTDTGTGSSSESGNGSDGTTEPPAEPKAVLDVPSDVDAGTSVTIDASASDPGGDDEIETYVWELTGGNEYETTTSEPTLEYAFDEPGTTEVALEVVTDADRRARTATTVEVEDRTLTVDGQVRHGKTDDTSFYDLIRLVDGGDVVAETRTDDDGSFTLSPDEPGTYGLVYVDARLESGLKPDTDGNVDLYAIDTVTIDDDDPSVDVGSQTLPRGFPLNLEVVGADSERPVEGATVTVTSGTDEAEIGHEFRTDENGRLFPDEDRAIEVTHAADVRVEPPNNDNFLGTTRTKNVDPGEDTLETITLAEVINASLEVDPNPAPLGKNVTVAVNETRGIAETVSWTVDGREWNGTNETIERIGEIRPGPGDRASENETIARSFELRVTEPGEFNVTARVVGGSRRTDTATTRINVTEPERELRLEVPDETATHTPFSVTAVHDVERGNVTVERYEWRLHDDGGTRIARERTTAPTAEFRVDEVGQYTLEAEIRDEFGLNESATTTVAADSVPSWATSGESRFELDAIEAPHAVEPGGSIPLEISTTNVGDASGTADVIVETNGETLVDDRLELDVGETESITLSPAAPERLGNHTLTVATDHERTAVSYTVTENPESSARLDSDSSGPGADEPQELDLLPTPSTAADIEPPSPPRNRVRNVLLGTAAAAILGGFGLVGYVIYRETETECLGG